MMADKPKICVLVPCYNHGHFLEQSVNSLLAQTYKNLEIFLINDASTDDSAKIMKDLAAKDDRINLVDIPTNTGKWNALNVGCQFTSASIITSQDADDVALPDRIERQYNCLVETNTLHNLCGFYHCWSEEDIEEYKDLRVSGDLSIMPPNLVNQLVSAGFQHEGINHYYTGEFETAGVSAMFYKGLWEIGLRFNPPSTGLRVLNSEDSDFNFRCTAMLSQTSVLTEQLYCYRRHTSTNNESI